MGIDQDTLNDGRLMVVEDTSGDDDWNSVIRHTESICCVVFHSLASGAEVMRTFQAQAPSPPAVCVETM